MAHRPSAADRARRLLGLLSHLKPNASIPLDELAAALGASPADVASDLQTLSMCGVHPYDPYDLVDVFVEEDGAVHVYSEPPALSRPVRLTPSEARALTTALRTCGSAEDDPLLAKLESAASPRADGDHVERLVRAHTDAGPSEAVHSTLARAAEEAEAVEAVYLSAGAAEPTTRTLHPHALGWRGGSWYLSARCESAGAERTFRVDRFLAVRATGQRFDRPAASMPAAPDFSAEELPVATLRVAPGERVSAREWPGATFEPAPDGSTAAHVPYSSARWIAREVLSRLGRVTVLEPAELRGAVRALAEEELAAPDPEEAAG